MLETSIPLRPWKIAFLSLTQLAALAAPPPQYVASRQIILECRLSSRVSVDDVLVWVSTDAGRSWQAAEVTRDGQQIVRYTAPADGRYDFYLVLRNAAGSSADPPEPGSRPTATIVVDTLPPLLQAHGAKIEPVEDCKLQASLPVTLVEENLSKAGVRLFYRDDSQHWTDGGLATLVDDRVVACLPTCDQASVDLRIVATDLAGNVASADVLGVESPRLRETPPEPAATQPAVPEPPPPTPPSAEAQRLRKLAGDFTAEGRFSLAAARLEDALALSPDNADLLVDLGTALYRAGRYDDARRRWQAALAAQPDHTGALDGLALAAVTQRQYPEAREYLLQLQRLRPSSGLVWLRSGDIEHRLGNTAQALVAWRKALSAAAADQNLRENARRRLEYFGSERLAETQPATGESWHEPPRPRPSLSSSETTTTKKPPP